jgi:glycerate kinase
LQPPFYIITRPFGAIGSGEIASLASQQLRRAFKTMQVSQYPLVGGEAGTLEQLVTATLGSFLEVEATAAMGEQLIVPIGFLSDGGSPGIIEMAQIARRPDEALHKKRNAKSKEFDFWGSTFGVGELIQDVLDEGAHSVLLGWEEPLAKDAGFGMAQAIGVKFLDKGGKELDFKSATPLRDVASIDLSGRSFQMLSSSFFLLRSESIAPVKRSQQVSVDDLVYEQELSRIAEIIRRDLGIQAALPDIDYSGSCIEFGSSVFLSAQIVDGSETALTVTGLEAKLAAGGGTVFFFADQLEDVVSDKAPVVSRQVMQWLSQYNIPVVIVTNQPFKPASETRYRKKHPQIESVISIADIPLFFEPLAADAPISEHRRYLSARLEKMFTRLTEQAPVAV